MSRSPLFKTIVPKTSKEKELVSELELDLLSKQGELEPLDNYEHYLKQNKFESFESWAQQVSNRWQPAIKKLEENGETESLLYVLLKEQQLWFERKCMKVPHCGKDNWILQFERVAAKLKHLFECAPPDVAPIAMPPPLL